MVETIKKGFANAGRYFDKILAALLRNRKTILYYIAVAAALAVIAIAAENYRNHHISAEKTAAPTQSMVTAVEAEPSVIIPPGAQRIRDQMTDPRWNDELSQWETHAGEDYVFDSDRAAAFSDGIVESISAEEAYVEIRSGELLLRYASVEPEPSLKTGDVVSCGDLIGFCGDSLRGEGHMRRHLHLEAFLDGKQPAPSSIAVICP